jgi:fused signal recognition particle receptor
MKVNGKAKNDCKFLKISCLFRMVFNFFKRAKNKIYETTREILHVIGSVFKGITVSVDDLESIEAALYRADFGRETTEKILESIKAECKNRENLHSQDILAICHHVVCQQLQGAEGKFDIKGFPEVICLLGINGVGKTTTAAKLAYKFQNEGHEVLLGVCDTFRAAASEQMDIWAKELKVDIVRSKNGADASAVAYDALSASMGRKKNIVILDTAGRLHNRIHLLEELEKLRRTILKKIPESQLHAWLVIDGNNGNNSLEQTKAFHKTFPLDGIIVSKLDGTSRGGAIVSIYEQLKIQIFYIGVGEKKSDLVPFSVTDYVQALF